MLTFSLNKHRDSFLITFNVPVDVVSSLHSEFSTLSSLFSNKKDCELLQNKQGETTGISGTFTSLMSIIETSLPKHEARVQQDILNNIKTSGNDFNKSGLNVNFHQNPFDTSFRHWQFILNQGYFTEYFFNRINWYIAPKNELVTPFPLHIDIESASTCNMNCPMCYRDELNDIGQMEYGLFKKIIDDCAANNVFSVRLSWRGETLTHPQIQKMIAYATKKIKNVSFLTNAFYITEEMADCFIECGVSYIAVSFDGIGKTYEAIRHPAKFSENYQRLAYLQEKKKIRSKHLPQIRLCTIWPAIKDNPTAYTETMSKVSDYIVCNPYINFKGPMKLKPTFICQYPWERIVIAYNGKAQCCTGWNADDIILGNTEETPIGQMWHSTTMNRIRQLHAAGKRMEISSCANCRHGSESDPDINISDIIERRY